MPVKIAMEIPYENMEEVSLHTDFDFALWHLASGHPLTHPYNKFYRTQARKGRQVWLDNSFHELKACPQIDELLDVAHAIGATHVVAPEVVENWPATLNLYKELRSKTNLIPVISWTGSVDDLQVFLANEPFAYVALPFDRDRRQAAKKLYAHDFHFFGFNSLHEVFELKPRSIDTSMPIRAAQQGLDLLSSTTRLDATYLDYGKPLTRYEINETIRNLGLMRHYGR